MNNIIVSAEAILGAQNSGKPLGGLGSAAPNPAGELTALPRPPSWCAEGLLLPPQTSPLLSTFGLDSLPNSLPSPNAYGSLQS